MALPTPPLEPEEDQRLHALREYRILDTLPEPLFDTLTRIAALVCAVPMAAVTLIDERRQWFKSALGISISETPRSVAFCNYTIEAKEVLVVNDAQADPRFRNNPLVRGEPEIRFYAGFPLITPKGFAIGTLAVMDRVPRELDTTQRQILTLLAKHLIEHLESQRSAGESTATLRAMIEANPLAVMALDLHGKVLLWNERAEQIFGYTREEVLGKSSPLVPPEDEGTHAEIMDRLLRGEPLLRLENRRGIHKGGHFVDVNISISAIRNDKGKIIGSLGMLDDITERKKIERNLIQFGSLVESSGDAIIGGTVDGIITAWNRGAERLYGYTADEMIGQSIARIYPVDRLQERAWILDAIKRGESIHNLETVRLRKNGEAVDVSVTMSIVKDSTGKPIAVSNIARDITEKKRAERELEQTLSLVRATLEATADGILALDRKGRVVGINQRFAEMWRLPKEIVERGDTQAGLEYATAQVRDPEYFQEKIRRYFAGEQLDSYDFIEFKDGRVLERYIHPQIINAEIVGYVFSYRDITRRRQLEEQLRQAQKMEAIGQLAGGIAHDFNNLLNVIIGYTELTKMNLPANDPSRANIDHVMKAAERAASLTRQLLIFSRKQVTNLEVVDVNRIVGGMSAMLRRLIGEDIELDLSLDKNTGHVKGDVGQLEQVVMNLAINARDAMPTGGKLSIRTLRKVINAESPQISNLSPGDHVLIEVQDTGQGIPDEIRSHIFEPFFTTKEPGKGTGLGLATVYGIVHQIGGEIELFSSPGKGATFQVILPVVNQGSSDQTGQASEVATGGHEVILVVEDEESLRKLICFSLSKQGYTVLDAKHGAEALLVANDYKGVIDMLITDVVMPGMRGWELAHKMTQLCPGIRVLYISGYTDRAVLDPTALGDNAAFLQKPFTPSALTHKVRAFLESKQTSRDPE